MKTKLIIALICLQFFTHVWYTRKLMIASDVEFQCRMSSVRLLNTLYSSLNDLADDQRAYEKAAKKVKYQPKILVNK